jgi:hypothetical protein
MGHHLAMAVSLPPLFLLWANTPQYECEDSILVLCCDLSNSIWNKEELPQQWKESIIVPIYKKADRTSNYQCIFLLSTSNNISSNIILSPLTPYMARIIRKHQCWVRCNQSAIRFSHSSDAGGKMITMEQNISYLQTSRKPEIHLGGSIVQYSHWVWGIRENS